MLRERLLINYMWVGGWVGEYVHANVCERTFIDVCTCDGSNILKDETITHKEHSMYINKIDEKIIIIKKHSLKYVFQVRIIIIYLPALCLRTIGYFYHCL